MSLPDSWMFASEILKFVMDADFYPNVSVAYRILLTVPVTVASAERSFSKLKLLKNYFEINYVARKVKWLWLCALSRMTSWTLLILIPFLMILHQEISKEVSFHKKQ